MIEFVLSRAWMVIAGLAMTAVVLAAFNGLDKGVHDGVNLEAAEALTGVIEEMGTVRGSAEIRIPVDDLYNGDRDGPGSSSRFGVGPWSGPGPGGELPNGGGSDRRREPY